MLLYDLPPGVQNGFKSVRVTSCSCGVNRLDASSTEAISYLAPILVGDQSSRNSSKSFPRLQLLPKFLQKLLHGFF